MLTGMTFNYDESELLPVEKSDSYTTTNGTTVTIYKVGDWTFESPDDDNIGQAKEAALAWIAWHEFLDRQD